MVSAEKHRKLLSDTNTRVIKKLMRQQLISKNSQKMERVGNHYLYSQGGRAGINSIAETEEKRAKANKEFIQSLKLLEA